MRMPGLWTRSTGTGRVYHHTTLPGCLQSCTRQSTTLWQGGAVSAGPACQQPSGTTTLAPRGTPSQIDTHVICSAHGSSNGSSRLVWGPASATKPPSRIQEAVARLRQAMCTTTRGLQDKEMMVSGVGRHLGIKVNWSIRWRTDGAFQEEIAGKQLGFRWGYDGRQDSFCWEVDSSGVARIMELDDHELLLLSAWIRTGLWLQPQLLKRLEVRIVDPGDAIFTAAAASADHTLSPASQNLKSNSSSSSSQSTRRRSNNLSPSSGKAQGTAIAAASATTTLSTPTTVSLPSSTTATLASTDSDSTQDGLDAAEQQGTISPALETPRMLVIGIKLKGGKLESRLRVCPHTWTILGLDQPLCGDVEVWQFGSWSSWQPHVLHPKHVSHEPVAGSQNVYVARSCTVTTASPLAAFQCPATPLLPSDTSFTPGVPPELPVWRAGSSHLLVRPTINGKEGGYMILDTGASGFVITPEAAVDLGLEPFGEMYAASMTGKVAAQFVQARSWCLGPLQVTSPVMMTMAVDGLVTGGPAGGDIIGIVGYDIFRRAVVELPAMRSNSHATPVDAALGGFSMTTSQRSSVPALPSTAPLMSPSGMSHLNQSRSSTYAGNNSAAVLARIPSQWSSSQDGFRAPISNSTTGTQGMLKGGWSAGHITRTSGGYVSNTSGGSGAMAVSSVSQPTAGPLPFLQGLINAASTGFGVGAWAAGRNHVQSSSTTTATSTTTQEASSSTSAAPHSTGRPSAGTGAPAVSSFMTGQVNASSSNDCAAVSSAAHSYHADSSSSYSSCDNTSTLLNISDSDSQAAISQDSSVGEKRFRRSEKSDRKREDERKQCQQFTMKLYHPDEYGPEQEEGWSWHTFKLVASLPHVEVKFPDPEGQLINTLLMVDSGAGGADVVLHTRAMRELNLLSRPTESFLRGVGGVVKDDHKDKQKFLQAVDMPWVELLGMRFTNVNCMHVGSSGLDISLYASGILCGNMLTRLPTVYDYARKRLGVKLPTPTAD